jgi:hypothetical protein
MMIAIERVAFMRVNSTLAVPSSLKKGLYLHCASKTGHSRSVSRLEGIQQRSRVKPVNLWYLIHYQRHDG